MKTASRWSLRHAAAPALAALLVAAVVAPAPAVTIGCWSGGSRTWNSSADFSDIRDLMTANGHVVEADEAMTAAALADNQMWVIGEAGSIPGAAELSALSVWVHGGGTLLVLADSTGVGAGNGSAILSGIGSAILLAGTPAALPLAGGIFASEGPPYDLVGQDLVTSPGTAATGGTALAGTFIQYEALGSGYVFAFADRSDTISPSMSPPPRSTAGCSSTWPPARASSPSRSPPWASWQGSAAWRVTCGSGGGSGGPLRTCMRTRGSAALGGACRAGSPAWRQDRTADGGGATWLERFSYTFSDRTHHGRPRSGSPVPFPQH